MALELPSSSANGFHWHDPWHCPIDAPDGISSRRTPSAASGLHWQDPWHCPIDSPDGISSRRTTTKTAQEEVPFAEPVQLEKKRRVHIEATWPGWEEQRTAETFESWYFRTELWKCCRGAMDSIRQERETRQMSSRDVNVSLPVPRQPRDPPPPHLFIEGYAEATGVHSSQTLRRRRRKQELDNATNSLTMRTQELDNCRTASLLALKIKSLQQASLRRPSAKASLRRPLNFTNLQEPAIIADSGIMQSWSAHIAGADSVPDSEPSCPGEP